MRPLFFTFFSVLLLSSCAATKKDSSSSVISMQLVDRNGFSETISTKDRIAKYKNTDFLEPQPYQKVLRVFSKNTEGKHSSTITTYHPSGYIWQYLDIVDGRANGSYKEWYPSGQMKMDLGVIEGFADLQESAKRTWVFDGLCKVWDEDGHLIAEINYEKGMLHGPSVYYFANGKIQKQVPYFRNEIDGELLVFDEEGFILEKIPYSEGMKEGRATGYFDKDHVQYEETYETGLLKTGIYHNLEGHKIAEITSGFGYKARFEKGKLYSLVEYQKGEEKGRVEHYNSEGRKTSFYTQESGKKQGEEWLFYEHVTDGSSYPKLCMHWQEDLLQGETKTWYPEGKLESQREYNQNKKHGLSLAWYKNGDVMLMEEYDQNALIKGSYFKKGDKKTVSKVENGKGTATIYSPEGAFIKKIQYEKGLPVIEKP